MPLELKKKQRVLERKKKLVIVSLWLGIHEVIWVMMVGIMLNRARRAKVKGAYRIINFMMKLIQIDLMAVIAITVM